MRFVSCVRCVAGGLAVTVTSFIGTAAFWLLGTDQAYAIPSPELVVGSFVSISQLFALASAVLGGGAAYATMRVRSRGGSRKMSRSLLVAAVGMFVLLVASVGINIYQYVTDANARQERLEGDADAPDAELGRQEPRPDPEGGQLRRSAEQSARHLAPKNSRSCSKPRRAARRQDTFLLDIRETAETEMGTMPGAKIVRFPDVKSSNIDFAGKTAILYCHNGNRGYETCRRWRRWASTAAS